MSDNIRYRQRVDMVIETSVPADRVEVIKAMQDGLAVTVLDCLVGEADQASITCPKCGMRSFHPMDVKEGYCGRCHAWTTDVQKLNTPRKEDP